MDVVQGAEIEEAGKNRAADRETGRRLIRVMLEGRFWRPFHSISEAEVRRVEEAIDHESRRTSLAGWKAEE